MASTRAELEALLAEMAAHRQQLLEKCFTLKEATARNRPTPEDWSPLEIVAHLAESERHYLTQALRVVAEERPELDPFDPATHGELIFLVDGLSVTDVVAELTASRDETLAAVRDLPEAALARTGRHVRWGEPTLVDVLARVRNHERAHLEQLETALAALGHS